MPEPESLVLTILRELRADLGQVDRKIDGLGADLRSEMHSLRADVASDFATLEQRLGDQIIGLRRAVMEYHSSAIGHACLFRDSRSGSGASSRI